jgi:tetratricopeptide (TPR) repeat protein
LKLPPYLLQEIRDGKIVLFLGAGASKGAIGLTPLVSVPDGAQLGAFLSDTFLGGQDKEKPLAVIADYAIEDSADLVTVQDSIRNLLLPFEPAQFHKDISNFKWAAIATTNYDTIIEKAYDQNPDRLQSLVPIIKTTDKFEVQLKDPRNIPYLKLHGCISRINDQTVPLILTIDQYVTHRKSRERIFDRFKSYAADFSVVFIGYKLEDPDLRQILCEIAEEGISRPRYYVVSPSPSERDARIWEQKKITALDGTFQEFVEYINSEIPSAFRTIVTDIKDHEIQRKFIKHQALSDSTLSFLNNDVDYLYPGYKTEPPNPVSFYKGSSFGWSAIAAQLDVERGVADPIITEVIIVDESERPQVCDFYLIKAYAGAGKSILLKRLAWDAANSFEKICLYYHVDAHITIEPIIEILELTGERIFIFIDRPTTRTVELERFIRTARLKKLPITIVCTERTNEWNNECANLNKLTDEIYELRSLSLSETKQLIKKLTQYHQLGTLSNQSEAEQINAFMQHADRQLLVALYEVTSGLPFEQIVFDEYRNIFPDEARNIYLAVCSLNRIGVPVRAGIIKRLTGITFADFKDKFFKPLESIVLVEEYKPALDMAYRARHPWIAEKVFERALPNPTDRFDHYLRLLEVLDIGYSPDRQAFREIIRAKSLLRIFSDPMLIRELYKTAEKFNEESAYLHQQWAIFEINRPNGNFDIAHEKLVIAQDLAPYDRTIKHSFAELELARASGAKTKIEKNLHLRNAKDIAKNLTGKNAESAHGYVTVARAGIESLTAALHEESPDDQTVTNIVKEIESFIQSGLEQFPDDEFLLSSESTLAELLHKEDRAVSALERAFKRNSASPFIVRSLTRLYEKRGSIPEARIILETCLNILPGDKAVNAEYARLLTDHYPEDGLRAAQHWRRSFTDGDTNYSSHFWYARQLFINGQQKEAREEFSKLRTASVSSERKHAVRGIILERDNQPKIFKGSVDLIENNFARFKLDTETYSVTLSRSAASTQSWSLLQRDLRVELKIGFNFHGVAVADFNPIGS